ncbi:MAG: tetratricopeptide repeat protein [Phycisphaeraceae bacterium]|nr:tetratricopeptide repeat protein [Phycisphaeraceae bacterium]
MTIVQRLAEIWRRPGWVGAAAIAVITLAAYGPAYVAGFVYDDAMHITISPTLTRSWDSLAKIWFSPAWTPQYYPITHTLWWLEYQLWGFNPMGYHVVNVLLHAGAAVLLWRLLVLLELDRRAALLAAAVFALHPVHVESAAFVSELKNVLSGVFYLSAAICCWRFDEARRAVDERRGEAGRWYAAAAGLFVAGLLCKTITASLPAAVLLVIWWKRGRLTWRDVTPLLPFFVVGAGLGATTAWLERHQIGTALFPEEFGFTPAQRVLIAGRAVCFYLGTLIWPAGLTIHYPRWTLDVGSWSAWTYPVCVAAVVVGLWVWRRRIGRGPAAAALFFIGTLFPALGFVDVYPFRFSFVADHYQYLASIGPLTLLAVLWVRGWDRWRGASAGVAAALPVLVLLGALTWRHAMTFRDEQTLWEDALVKNPSSWLAHVNLSAVWMNGGETERALSEMGAAVALRPDLTEWRNRYASLLASLDRDEEAEAYLRAMVERGQADGMTHANLSAYLVRRGDIEGALREARLAMRTARDPRMVQWTEGVVLLAAGRPREAKASLDAAAEAAPLRSEIHRYLAQAQFMLGQSDAAIASLKTAARILPHDVELQVDLADTLIQYGRGVEAIGPLLNAVEAAPTSAGLRVVLGRQLMAAGRLKQGLRQLLRARDLTPKDAEVLYELARAQAEVGRRDDAMANAQEAMMLANGQRRGQIAANAGMLLRELQTRGR